MRTRSWSENLKVREHSEDVGVDSKIILEWISGKEGGKVWIGCIWLSVGISGEMIRTWVGGGIS
jgi:hypothetical protein